MNPKRAVLLHLAALLVVGAYAHAGHARQPNIVFLVSDDQRPDTIRALGNPVIETPNLDSLVRRGTVFPRATCANPICVPSRAEMMTGCTTFRNGWPVRGTLNPKLPLWAEVLRRAGYRTWYVGKWHTAGRPSERGYEAVDGLFGGGPAPANQEFDRRGRPITGYRGWQFRTDDGKRFPEKGVGLTANISEAFADAAIRFLKKAKEADRPFFLHVNFTAPHDPRFFPAGYEKKYDPARMPLPGNFRPEHPFDHGNVKGRDEVLLPTPRTPADIRSELAVYYALISHLDGQIGRILAVLDEAGLTGDTIVIFSSDHGLALGSHGLIGKQNMYEHTIGVPLIMAGPGVPVGERRAAQCYLRDLYPTTCELAGVPIPATVEGKSLVPVLAKKTQQLYPFIVGYFDMSQRMIRDERHSLIWYPIQKRVQLFDVAHDPLQLVDLSDDPGHAVKVRTLRAQLETWLREQGDPLFKER